MRADQAVERKHSGFNCCQSVVLSYADEIGLPEETLARLASGFAGGMGTREGVCGALNGAVMVLGLLNDGTVKPVKAAKEAQLAFRENIFLRVIRVGVSSDFVHGFFSSHK